MKIGQKANHGDFLTRITPVRGSRNLIQVNFVELEVLIYGSGPSVRQTSKSYSLSLKVIGAAAGVYIGSESRACVGGFIGINFGAAVGALIGSCWSQLVLTTTLHVGAGPSVDISQWIVSKIASRDSLDATPVVAFSSACEGGHCWPLRRGTSSSRMNKLGSVNSNLEQRYLPRP